MATTCTRCECSGFLNLHQVPDEIVAAAEVDGRLHNVIQCWMRENDNHDVQVCDCCGNGDEWHGEPGEHDENTYGKSGPYAYNGGLPECY